MTFGAAPPQPPRRPVLPKLLRALWRVERRNQFRCQIIQAALFKHPHGVELRVFIEPAEADNLLHSEIARFDFTPVEQKASELRSVLLEKGWTQLAVRSDSPAEAIDAG